jgi:predicted Rossmann fold flavoprotein
MIVVVGAGAAGLVAAIFARTSGHPVTLLERTADGGRKILISGGGRCNVLPQALEPRRFVTESSPQVLQRLLRSWPLKAQLTFFEQEVGVPLKLEAESRKWFPVSNSARDVRDGLVTLARNRDVVLRFNADVRQITHAGQGWRVESSGGDLDAAAVIIATGGLSVPTTGSSGSGLAWARSLGHTVRDTYAALTPLVADPSRHAALAGVSLDVVIRAASTRLQAEAEGGFLFTHRGYSGPAVLDVSHVVTHRAADDGDRPVVRVQWSALDERQWHDRLIGAASLVSTVLSQHLPRRLAETLLAECGLDEDLRATELRREDRARLVERLVRYELPWTGDEGYKKAEVTGGGVALEEVDPRTLESRRHHGLFLCGEMLDAFGPIGGHNFAWAWATGRLAGLGAAKLTSAMGPDPGV